jgi:hypothetical protein
MAKHPTDLDAFEAQVVRDATGWTTFVAFGPWDRRRVDHASLDAAKAAATAQAAEVGKSVLIYAITPAGRSVMLGHVTAGGAFCGALRA